MNTVWVVMKKELVDFSRDRRSVVLSLLLLPLVAPVMTLGSTRLMMKQMESGNDAPLELAVVGAEHAPNLLAWLGGQNVVVLPGPPDPEAAIREERAAVVLRIAPTFKTDWRGSLPATVEVLHDSSRSAAQAPVERITRLLKAYGDQVGASRLLARGVSPAAGQALRVADSDLVTPTNRGWGLLSMLPIFVLVLAFTGPMAVVIDVTAGERERQSLEPLLATPTSRRKLVAGKLLAASLCGVVALALSLLLFKLGLAVGTQGEMKADLSWSALTLALVALTPLVLFGTALLTAIAAGAKSVKEAQSWLGLLVFAPMLPSMALTMSPVKNQLWMMAVPFLSQHQLLQRLLRNERLSATEWSVYGLSAVFLAMVCWSLSVRRYQDERLAISA